MNTAATVSGPSISIRSATSSAQRSVQASRCAQSMQRKRYGVWTLTNPGSSGSNGALIAGTPVTLNAPIEVPW